MVSYSFQVLSSADVCDSHKARAQTSLSKCIQVALLRLQDLWLPKIMISGVVIPAVRLMMKAHYTDSTVIVLDGQIASELKSNPLASRAAKRGGGGFKGGGFPFCPSLTLQSLFFFVFFRFPCFSFSDFLAFFVRSSFPRILGVRRDRRAPDYSSNLCPPKI